MNNVKYMNLAAARMANPQGFDAAIERAVTEAMTVVGLEAVVRSLSERTTAAQDKKIAA